MADKKFFVSYCLAGIGKMRTVFAPDVVEARASVAKDVEMVFGTQIRKSTAFNVRESGQFTIHFGITKVQRRA